jgi:hypothetical protein
LQQVELLKEGGPRRESRGHSRRQRAQRHITHHQLLMPVTRKRGTSLTTSSGRARERQLCEFLTNRARITERMNLKRLVMPFTFPELSTSMGLLSTAKLFAADKRPPVDRDCF